MDEKNLDKDVSDETIDDLKEGHSNTEYKASEDNDNVQKLFCFTDDDNKDAEKEVKVDIVPIDIVPVKDNKNKIIKIIIGIAVAAIILAGCITYYFTSANKEEEEAFVDDSNKVVASTDVSDKIEITVTATIAPSPTVVPDYEVDLNKDNLEDLSSIKEIEKLTSLIASGKEITSITSLDKSIRLEYLNLSNNKVSDISSLQNLYELSYLDLSNNEVRDLAPINELTAIETLLLTSNKIPAIDMLSDLKNLVELRIDNNAEINDISVLRDMENLEILILANTGVTDITPLYNLKNLTLLDLTGLNISPQQLYEFSQKIPDCIITKQE